MSHPPIPNRPLPSALPFVPLRPLMQAHTVTTPEHDSSAIFSRLREAIAAGAFEFEPVLAAIVEAARILTSASGAAIALRDENAVICRARSGETAPAIGARLSEDSGISGECLRTGKMLRCNDTQTDYRVDPEVCRGLGVHSIVVVPVRGRKGTIGVLEAFSTRFYAFGEDHITFLTWLAELVEAALAREATARSVAAKPVRKTESVVEQAPEIRTQVKTAASARSPKLTTNDLTANDLTISEAETLSDASAAQALLARLRERLYAKENFRYRFMGAMSMAIVVLAIMAWITLRTPGTTNSRTARSSFVQTQPLENPLAAESAANPLKPPSGHPARSTRKTKPERAQHNAASSDSDSASDDSAEDVVTHVQSEVVAKASLKSPSEKPQEIAEQDDAPAPKIASDSSNSVLAKVLVEPVSLPRLNASVSQGVTPGELQHRVQPVYPAQAQAMHIEGNVILSATVGEDGSVRSLKVVSGHPMLARAAEEAVRQWRYRPALLNGKPVAMETRVTISFKNP